MKIRYLVLSLALAATPVAWAHDDTYLDSIQTPHGGQMRMAGAYHLELVVQAAGLDVYVTDHADAAVPAEGAVGQAKVLAGGRLAEVGLMPVGGHRLSGTGSFAPDPDMKVVVSVSLPGQPTAQARFTPFAKRAAAPQGDQGHQGR